jgi:membrane protein YqaA with SNARE-associated domain
MKLLLATFGIGVASALFPLINMEVFLAGVGALVDSIGIWPVAVIAATGQTIGKVLWYEFGRSSLQWRYLARKMERPRWQRNYNKVRSRTDDQPWNAMALLFVAATVGLPPLAVVSVIAGQLRFNRFLFIITTMVGRILRFAVVLGGVSWITRHF